MLTLAAVIALVLLMSGLCSGTEAALFSIPEIRVRQIAQTRKRAALALLEIRKNISRPIVAIVILNNVANIGGSFLVSHIGLQVLGNELKAALSGVVTLLVIFFSEIIPKTLGERYSEKVALAAALPVRWLTFLLTPLIWLIEKGVSALTPNDAVGRATVNEAELKLMAQIGHKEGVLQKTEADIIHRVFDLANMTASDLMTPRVALTHVEGALSLKEACDQIIDSPHTRIIVTSGSKDKVTGLILKAEALAAVARGDDATLVSELQYPVRFLPEAMRAAGLLDLFRTQRQHLAVVVDEFGGVAGVVTLEDVLEILTGEIVDETDRTVNLRKKVLGLLKKKT